MATIKVRRFCDSDVLRSCSPNVLFGFLRHPLIVEFLANQGFKVPAEGSQAEADYDLLSKIFLDPAPSMPAELLDAIFHVAAMADDHGIHALVQGFEVERVRCPLPEDATAADIALWSWQHQRRLLLEKHAERETDRVRSFVSYFVDPTVPLMAFTNDVLTSLRHRLAGLFANHRLGAYCSPLCGSHDGVVTVLVRRGNPYQRQGCITGDEIGGVHFRPLKCDVLSFNTVTRELRMSSNPVQLLNIYRAVFGEILAGDPGAFAFTTKYSLDPIREDGRACTVCADVPGMEQVVLKAVQIDYGDGLGFKNTLEADDLFEYLEVQTMSIPRVGSLHHAVFEVKLTGCKRGRSVKVYEGNRAAFTRDEHAPVIEAWLEARGFIITSRLRRSVGHAAVVSG